MIKVNPVVKPIKFGSFLVDKEVAGFIYKDPRKVNGRWVRGIKGLGGICRELTDDLEMTDRFTLTAGQGYATKQGLRFSQAFTEHHLRLKYNLTGGKRGRKA